MKPKYVIRVVMPKRDRDLSDVARQTLAKMPKLTVRRGQQPEKPPVTRAVGKEAELPESIQQRKRREARRLAGGVSFRKIAEATLAKLPRMGR